MTERDIDALVAEKVMGWELNEHAHSQDKWYYRKNGQIFGMAKFVKDWNPSTNISAAWQVAEKFNDEYIVNLHRAIGVWTVDIYDFETGKILAIEQASTAPMAICLAALKAKGVEVA